MLSGDHENKHLLHSLAVSYMFSELVFSVRNTKASFGLF